jgi:CelD/BcsL family acetyltransferase involved in cellulose biosynthesis
MLHRLIAWKSDQYRRTNQIDRFERPWLVGLLDALLAIRSDQLSGLLSVLYAEDQPVAAQFGLRTGNLLVGWFTAYDIRFRKYSPGLINLKQMAEELAATGIHAIHMGRGATSYTQTLKSNDIFVAEGVVTSRSVLGVAHRAHGAFSRWAVRTIRRQHPSLRRTADQTLRRTGVARRIYGRI